MFCCYIFYLNKIYFSSQIEHADTYIAHAPKALVCQAGLAQRGGEAKQNQDRQRSCHCRCQKIGKNGKLQKYGSAGTYICQLVCVAILEEEPQKPIKTFLMSIELVGDKSMEKMFKNWLFVPISARYYISEYAFYSRDGNASHVNFIRVHLSRRGLCNFP